MCASRAGWVRMVLAGAIPVVWACGSSDVQFVQLPDHGTPTTLLAYRSADSDPFTLHVYGEAEPGEDGIRSESEVFALHYTQTAAELGLEPDGLRRCSLLSPLHVEYLEDLRFGPFVGPLPEALRRALVPEPERCSPCRALDMHSVSYSENGALKAGTWLDSGPVVSHGQGGFRRVDRERSDLVSGCELPNPIVKFTAIARAGPNEYWVGSELGELMRVSFDDEATTCTVRSSTVAMPGNGARTGFLDLRLDPFDPDPETVYGLLTDGRILRYDRGRFEPLGTLSLHPLDADDGRALHGQLLFTAAGRGVATVGWSQVARWSPSGVERVDDLQLPVNQFIRDGGQRVTALAYDAREDRLLAGAAQGLVFAYDPSGNAWVPILQLPIMKEVRAFEDFGDRWLIIIEQGDLVVWHRETGLCPEPIRIPLAINSGPCKHHARRGSGLAIFDALGDIDRPMGVAWIQED